MIEIAILIGAAATIAILALVIVLVARPGGAGNLREQAARDAAEIRGRLDAFAKSTAEHERDIRADLAAARREQVDSAVQLRRELGDRLTQFQAGTQQALSDAQAAQRNELVQFGEQLGKLTLTVEQRLDGLRNENAQKLEQMRATVDEKLQATLEQRLCDSFRHVSERLEQVHRGLGEMQTLAAGVGDLKRVLQNVKTRGGWGEVQLGALLSDILTPQQYESNVEVMPGSGQRVEFAIRLPGRDGTGRPCWLPVDAKFPLADWQRLQDALERADVHAAEDARKALADVIRSEAKTVRTSYIAPPHTTDFAILFLPTEGLYAELVARPGFADALQRDFRVLITGPMNLSALLNSLQMGFRTLAIEQRSAEVWRVLGAVKTEFRKFGDVLAKTKERLDKASEELERAGVRRRAVERQLREVEALPEPDATKLIGPSILPDTPGGSSEIK